MPEWFPPVEAESNIPLLIRPNKDLPPPNDTASYGDWHHSIFPSTLKELKGTSVSAHALRQIRVEWVDADNHYDYHEYADAYMADEWRFPRTLDERFGMVVLMGARYIPPEVVEIKNGKAVLVMTDEDERRSYWDRGILKIADENSVWKFLRSYVLNQNVAELVGEDDIADFLITDNDEVRIEKGNLLLMAAAMLATDSTRPTYIDAHKKGLILPEMPAEPHELIISDPFALGTKKRKRRARTELREKLALQYDIDLAEAA